MLANMSKEPISYTISGMLMYTLLQNHKLWVSRDDNQLTIHGVMSMFGMNQPMCVCIIWESSTTADIRQQWGYRLSI